MRTRTFVHHLLSLLISASLLLTPAAPTAQAAVPQAVSLRPEQTDAPQANSLRYNDFALYRTHIAIDSPARRARLDPLGVVVLEEGEGWAVVLADDEQLETLARLRYEPRASDEFVSLVEAHADANGWLAAGLSPLLAVSRTNSPASDSRTNSPAYASRASLRAAARALTPEQRTALADLTSLDDDADGLTNVEESWWCTDPLNPNSDGDAQGYSDGEEVKALLDFTQPRSVRWGYGPPFGPPNAWPNFNNRDGSGVNACNDGDFDTIPDKAEAYFVGSRTPSESTDNDKFDDGQELFGVTYCPGAPTNCGYGSYPAVEYWNFIKATMPNWVLPPGDNLFVAAFPVPEVYVLPGSWTVERVTTITTSEGQMTETTNSYETAVTRGQGTSIADTVTWNEWEEVSQAVETPLGIARVATQPDGWKDVSWGKLTGGTVLATGGTVATAALIGTSAAACIASIVCGLGLAGAVVVTAVGAGLIYDEVKEGFKDDVEPQQKYSPEVLYCTEPDSATVRISLAQSDCGEPNTQEEQNLALTQQIDHQGIVNSLDGVSYAVNRQGELLAQGLHDISYQLSRPRLTETRTTGKSWGGAQTTTHEVYEEHTISEGQAFATGQTWETAWAVDSSHAADLNFVYTVQNSGTEYARELTGLVFNIYLGDDKLPIISYPAWEQFAGGKLENLFPVGPNTPPGVGTSHIFASNDIPLSLEQMKRIDLGERLTVKVENFNYGADELFYTDAVSGGVTVFIEDGVEDGDESVDQYVMPTWGVESVQDVLTRYFPAGYDDDNLLNALWTPEFDGANAPTWNEHFLSDISWWNVYLTQSDAGNTSLKDLSAQAGSGILFRFNRDSDRDGYNDRAEFRYFCGLPPANPDAAHCADGHLRAEIHPQPEILAGYVAKREGDRVVVTLALENTGTFDAYGIDAVIYSPDDTTTIGNNTVGGNGRVRPGNQVAVGSIIKAPDLASWGNSTARPYAGGNYGGDTDLTYTFTTQMPGVVGTGNTEVRWENGNGVTGTISLGSGYHAPLPVDVEKGLEVGFNTGTVDAGASFTVQALTPRDTFSYTINSEPFTPPVIVVSYSDPQGSHRFITPIELSDLQESLTPFAGQMLHGLKMDVVTNGEVDPTGVNTTSLILNSPHETEIEDGHIYLNFVSDGTLVLEKPYTLDMLAGPTIFNADWSVSEFSADFDPEGDNLLIAFWTDSENNIIDSAARPLPTFADDPRPAAALDNGAQVWDFGAAQQGTLLEHPFTLASVGYLDLLAYLGHAPGLSVDGPAATSISPGDIALYTVQLNTESLPVGAYEATIPVRTSDPQNPAASLTIRGTITEMPGDAPGGAVLRPLDVNAAIPGNHSAGEWVEFTHSLGPDAASLHPVKVYSQDYGTLHGVGKYATDFGAGTASAAMFGTGADGDLTISSDTTFNPPRTLLAAPAAVGDTTVFLNNATGFTVDDEILLLQTQSTGVYEFGRITAISGNQLLTLREPLKHAYTIASPSKTQVVRVPNYHNLTITPTGRWRAPAWDGNTGGILVFRASGIFEVQSGGLIDANGKGFRGGNRNNSNGGAGQQGESQLGVGSYVGSAHCNTGGDTNRNGMGGGGGNGDNNPTVNRVGGGGAGGGHRSEGGRGGCRDFHAGGQGGQIQGDGADEILLFGGAGGAGGNDNNDTQAGAGGNGGGIILVAADEITINGSVTANGTSGGNGSSSSGAGGGGAGGSIKLIGSVVDISNNYVSSIGGGAGSGNGSGSDGGGGGIGWIRIEYCTTHSGSATPGFLSEKLNCYIAEQVETAPYDTARLNLPETFSGGRTFSVQYGREANFDSAGGKTAILRLPKQLYSDATLDVLINNTGVSSGPFTFSLDVGNDGTADWTHSGTTNFPATLNAGGFVAALNAYLISQSQENVAWGANADVPVRVVSDRAADVLLMNLQLELSTGPTEVLSYLSTGYRYAIVSDGSVPAGFELPEFDDSAFAIGDAAFGTSELGCPLQPNVKTSWPPDSKIILRKQFDLPLDATNVKIEAAIDNDIQVFVNGFDVSNGLQVGHSCGGEGDFIFSVPHEYLNAGENLLAVLGSDRGGATYLDVQITAEVPQAKKMVRLPAREYAEAIATLQFKSLLLMADDFSDAEAAQWTVSQGTWQVVDGVFDAVGAGGSIDAWVYAGDTAWTDYSFQTRVKMVNGNGEIVFRSTGHWQNEYRLSFWPATSGDYPNKLYLKRYKNGEQTLLWSEVLPIQIPEDVAVRVDIIGDRIQAYLNGKKWIDLIDPDSLPSGRIGLGVIWDRHAQFDDVRVYSLDDNSQGHQAINTGSLAFTVDVGADGIVDWSYAGNPGFPVTFATADLSAAINSYLTGRAGVIDVPLHIVTNSFVGVSLIDFDADPADRPDLIPQAPTAGAARNGTPIVEGDTVPLTALVQNNGPADSGPLAVTFYAIRNTQSFYIGTSFVPNIPRSDSRPATIQWNTLGFPGDTTVRAVVDPFNRTPEGNEANNSAEALIPIRTRPDLHVTAIQLSNPLLMAGEMVTVTLTLSNSGQTAAGSQTVELYNANPDSGGTSVGALLAAPVAGETATTIQFQWTPATPGPYRLFSLSDKDGAVVESDEGNNRSWQDVYVGLAAPVLLDSGPNEPAYNSSTGYGVVDEGQPDVTSAPCGSGATVEETQRLDFDGRVVYRFDHLLPGRYYHLDVTLYECTGAGRQQSIYIDGNLVDGPVNLGDGEVHHRSILIDPALYADHSVEVSIESPGVNGAIVSAVNLHAVDYRYADSGGVNDPDYSAGLGYGALNGVKNSAWGRLPYQNVRVNQTGRSVDYRYDGLVADKFYQLHLSFFQTNDTSRVQQVEIDGKLAGAEIALVNNEKQRITLPVPTGTYTDDGSISVSVVRVNANVGAIVNEIALEEVTVPTAVCGVASTPYWTYTYGSVTIEGAPALPGTVVTAENENGDIVGCYRVEQSGFYSFMPIFGSLAPTPGMAEGEQVKFRVNGQLALTEPTLNWTNDKDIHQIDLTISGIESQWIRLNPGWTLFSLRVQPPVTALTDVLKPVEEAYCDVHGESDIFDCNLPPQAQGLTELHGGRAYYIRNNSSATANLFVQGAPITPTRPIALHTDWNWVGYLLSESTPVGDALASIAGKYTRVADGKARLYRPDLPQFSTLTQLVPDDGYLVFMTDTAALVYPEPLVAAVTEPVAVREICGDVSPTPAFTWIYGGLLVNGQPAAVGSRVDVLTPRGELAGCFTVDSVGLYGFLPVYGADNGNPPLPGFADGEPMTLRVNGQVVELAQALLWRNDKQEHLVDLSATVEERRFFLPLIGASAQAEGAGADTQTPVYLPILGR